MRHLFPFFAVLSLWGGSCLAQSDLEQQMLGHVEKIVVVDSLVVPRQDFFARYRLQPSAGRVLSTAEVKGMLKGVALPDDFTGQPATGYTNEFNDYVVWAQPDTTGHLRIAESVRLLDGSWSTPLFTPVTLNNGVEIDDADDIAVLAEADAAFPFMADDGQTLYFAANNDLSLGGYDIFIVSKDPADGSFLLPGNLGMPFNSPYDDYMMVIDYQTGVGWWASDRNQIEDAVTIYVYALSDNRENVDPADENLTAYATLSGWQAFQDEAARDLRRTLEKEIRSIPAAAPKKPQFSLPMPGGKTYHYYSDFRNTRAATLMRSYEQAEGRLLKQQETLAQLREKYHKARSAADRERLAPQIADLEQQLRDDEVSLRQMRSEIYNLESSSN